MKKTPLLFFILISSYFTCFAQERRIIDSLQNELKKFDARKKDLGNKATPLMDSTKANFLYSICSAYRDNSSDSALGYAQKCLVVSQNIGYKRGIGISYNIMGQIYSIKNNYSLALECYKKSITILNENGDKLIIANSFNNIANIYAGLNNDSAALWNYKELLKVRIEIGDKNRIARTWNVIGNFYYGHGNYPEALTCYLEQLNCNEEVGNKKGIADSYFSIGQTYTSQGNYPEAIKNFLASLTLSEKMGYKSTVARAHNEIGKIYYLKSDYQEALKNELSALKISQDLKDSENIGLEYNYIAETYQKQNNYAKALINAGLALTLYEKLINKSGIAHSYFNFGLIYFKSSDYPNALKNDLDALKIEEGINEKGNAAASYVNISEVYSKQGNLQQALHYGTKGLALVLATREEDDVQEAYENLADINAKLGNYKAAYNDEVLFKQYYDSIYNKTNEKKLTSLQMQYDFDKKQDSIKAEQVKKDALTGKEIKDQKRIRNYTMGGLLVVFFFLVFVFLQRNRIAKEKRRSDELLLNILPSEVADELKEKGSADAKQFDDVTVIFTDFKGFTAISEKLTAKELVSEIDYCFKGFDAIIGKYGIEKIKTIGDSYMAAGGLPVINKTHAKDVVNVALEIVQFMEVHKQQRIKEDKPVFEIRIGINTGPVVAGIVGVKKFAYDIWGDTVNLASRMESSGEPGKVNISGSTYELVKNDFTCTYRGKIQAKNKGEVDMYFVG